MAVSVEDIAGLKNKKIYDTSNEKIVLAKDYERIIHAPLLSKISILSYHENNIKKGLEMIQSLFF